MENDSENSSLYGFEELREEDQSLYGYVELNQEEADVRKTLLECIDEIQVSGKFATGSVLETLTIPGISVDGGEPIAIPLSEEAAQDLASKSDEGGGLQISAERISFQNSQWDGFVNKLVQRVIRELGVSPAPKGRKVYAKLHKHLLYKPGAIFKPHEDNERCPGVFGTLVICLPSKHKADAIRLHYQKDSFELSTTAEMSAYSSYYVAWHTDVTHEIQLVQAGYRWVLMYHLVSDYQCPSASMLHSQTGSLVKALSSWESMHNPPDFLIYPLDHQYTTTDLRLSSLKGLDYHRVHCLNDSCNQHGGFHLFLAQLDKRKIWPNDEDEDDDFDIDCRKYLHHVSSLEGFTLSPQKVNVDEVLPLKSISCESDPDVRIGRQYLGRQRGDIKSNPVLLIVRINFLHVPLFNPRDPQEVDRVMTHLREGIDDNNKATVQKIIFCICRIILNEGFAAKAANDKYLGYVVATAACLGDRSLLKEACNKTLMTSRWNENTWVTLGALIDRQTYPEVVDILMSLTKYGTFCVIYRGLTNFYNGLYKYNSQKGPGEAEYWTQWYSDKLTETLNLCNALDGPEAVNMIDKIILDPEIQYTPEQRKKIDKAVTGLINRFKHAKDFVFALNVNLLRHLSFWKDAWRKEILNDLFSVILESAISTFDFDWYHNHGMLHIFYKEALARDKGSALKLLQQVLKNTCRPDKSTALGILMSLIKELLSLDDTDSSEVQSQLLLNAYITEAAGVKPLKPEGWARPAEARICPLKCKACDELNLFLNDPKEEEITIALTAAHQRHVEEIYVYLKIGNGDREGEVRLTKTLERWNTRYHNWKSRVKAAKDMLKKAFGNKYNRLTGSTVQAADKAQLTLRPKRKRGEDTDNERAQSKRARRDGEKDES